MSNKATAFAGFLNGYKARNIAASASSVTYHFEEMRKSVVDIIITQRSKKGAEIIIESLERLSNILSAKEDNFLSSAISIGEVLKTILLMAKKSDNLSELLGEEKMKRLVYHYLEFAELSEDKTIGDLAISIAEIFLNNDGEH